MFGVFPANSQILQTQFSLRLLVACERSSRAGSSHGPGNNSYNVITEAEQNPDEGAKFTNEH
jgi:hypothetical protein